MQETQFQDTQRLNRTLNGQRVVLIGGTSGFGFATAKAAAREGALIIVASSSKARPMDLNRKKVSNQMEKDRGRK
jgi:NAD(P)-dependent dehydrogenase (short-subunit alcohol dehydrogenase family)